VETTTDTEVTAPARFEDAFADLYRLAYRVAFRILGDRGDAEDAAQETLSRAHQRWSRLAPRPEGWVATVAGNLAIDRIRRRRRVGPRPDGGIALVDPLLVERLDLARALRTLPRRQRQVVVLRYLADHSELDVADELGCSPGAVKTHASRGLAALRRVLDAGDPNRRGDVQPS
jgi:RNA polymerase sigma-70 factor (sigma-E family)